MTGPLGSSKATTGSVVGGVFNLSAPLPADGQSSALQLDSAGNLLVNVAVGGGGGGSNLSVGVTGATAPTSATEIGTIDGTGKLQGVSATNPLPISGSISATNPSVGTTNVAAPTSATEIGVIDGTGKLQGASSTNPVRVDPTGTTTQPVSGSVSVSNFPVTQPVTLPAGQAVELLDSAGTNKASISAAGALKVDGSAVTQPVSGTFFQGTQPVSAASLPLPSGAATDASVTGLQVAQASATAGEKGPLVQGAVTTAAPTYTTGQTDPLSLNTAGGLRVDGSGVTQPVSIAAAVSVNNTQQGTASQNVAQFGGTNVATGTGAGGVGIPRVTISNDSSLAANQSVNVNQVGGTAAAATAKGTQATNGIGVQDLKDAGRNYLSFTALAAAGVVAEALFSFSQSKQGTVTAGVSSYTITSGKTLRITSISISVRAGAAAVPFSRCALRHNPAGATIATSPIAYLVPEVFGISATIGVGGQISVPIPDGLEFFGNGTQTIGMSHLDQATTNILNVTVYGFEY